jgi:hypothetical protein
MDGSLGLGTFPPPLLSLLLSLLFLSIKSDIVEEELMNRRNGFQ